MRCGRACVVIYGIPEFAHSGREFFRNFRCVNHSAIHDEKLFEIHYGVHAETLLASLVAPSPGWLQSSAIIGSNSRLASNLGTKASTKANMRWYFTTGKQYAFNSG